MTLLDHLNEYRDKLTGDFVIGVEANRFVQMMERDHRDELEEWMRCHVVAYVAETFGDVELRERSRALHRAGSRAFAHALEESGGSPPLFSLPFVVDGENTRRPLGQMNGADCRFAAGEYTRRGNRQLAMAAFLEALAKKAKNATVSSVLSETQAERLLRSLMPSDVAEVVAVAA